jgi:hypothetical protein
MQGPLNVKYTNIICWEETSYIHTSDVAQPRCGHLCHMFRTETDMVPDRHFPEKQSKTHKKKTRIDYSLNEVQNKLLTLISKHVSGNKRSPNCVTIPIPNSDHYAVFISLLIKQRDAVPCPPGTVVCTNLCSSVSSSSNPCSKRISGRYLVVQLIRITGSLLCLVCSVLASLS